MPSSSSARIAADPPFPRHHIDYGARAMTLPGTSTAALQPPARRVWRAEIVETIKLAWPIALTQLGQIAMMTTDLALIGRLGDTALASVGLAHMILFLGFVVGMGVVSAVAALAAQAFGARAAAHGAPRAAGRPVGRSADRRPDQYCAALGRDHPARIRAGERDRGACRALSARADLVDDPGLVLHRAAQLHGRGQSPGAGAVGDAGGDPGQRRCSPTD